MTKLKPPNLCFSAAVKYMLLFLEDSCRLC
ncbi:BnaC09g54730D, partial [Brassica napus]